MIDATIIYFLIAGAVGGLLSDILKDNSLEMPKVRQGQFYLGFIGPLIIGAVVGAYIDGTILMAFLGGFAGKAIIQNLIPHRIDKLVEKVKNNTILKPAIDK